MPLFWGTYVKRRYHDGEWFSGFLPLFWANWVTRRIIFQHGWGAMSAPEKKLATIFLLTFRSLWGLAVAFPLRTDGCLFLYFFLKLLINAARFKLLILAAPNFAYIISNKYIANAKFYYILNEKIGPQIVCKCRR